jgi:hypothetical protein
MTCLATLGEKSVPTTAFSPRLLALGSGEYEGGRVVGAGSRFGCCGCIWLAEFAREVGELAALLVCEEPPTWSAWAGNV